MSGYVQLLEENGNLSQGVGVGIGLAGHLPTRGSSRLEFESRLIRAAGYTSAYWRKDGASRMNMAYSVTCGLACMDKRSERVSSIRQVSRRSTLEFLQPRQ